MCENEPPNEVDLLRLIWDPDDIVDGELQPSAFPKDDLVGDTQRSLSVDRTDVIVPEAVRHVAEGQQERARINRQENPERNNLAVRDESYGAIFQTGAAREIEISMPAEEKGSPDVILRPIAISPDRIPAGHALCPMGNEAHCAVANTSGHRSKAFLNALRAKLVAAVHTLRPLDELLEVPASEGGDGE